MTMLHKMICFTPGWIRWVTVQTKPQYRGIINCYTHIGSAVTKGCMVPFFPVPLYNKVNKNIQILKKKKSQLALPTNSCSSSSLRNPNPVEFPYETDAHQSQYIDN